MTDKEKAKAYDEALEIAKTEMNFYRQGIEDTLKSLRPSWKPSEEQMYALGTVVKGAGDISVGSVGYNLKKLYEQLKKLM